MKRQKRSHLEDRKTKNHSISQLSHQDLTNILSRLPLRTIFRCICVCKKWKNLILQNPGFAELHLERSPDSYLILRSRKHGRRCNPRTLCFLDLEAFDICSHEAVVKLIPDFGLPIEDFEVVNTIHGLICCVSYFMSLNRITILNPLVGEFVSINLPQWEENKFQGCEFFWFGFSPKTIEYKVARFLVCQSLVLKIEVYTLGVGKWRSIEGCFNPFDKRRYNAFVEGSLHWIVQDHWNPEFINSFDIGDEKFRFVPPPSPLSPRDKERSEYMMLGVLRGCLYLFDYPLGEHFEIWVMKRYQVQESWSRDFIIKNPITDVVWYWDLYRPIWLMEKGEILMAHKSKAMVSYNPENRSFKFLKIHGIQNFEAITYVPSFVSVQGIVKGENLKVHRFPQSKNVLLAPTKSKR